MKFAAVLMAGAAILAPFSAAPVWARQMNMPGMSMPMPMPAKPRAEAKRRPKAKPRTPAKPQIKTKAAAHHRAAAKPAKDHHQAHDLMAMPMPQGSGAMPATSAHPSAAQPPMATMPMEQIPIGNTPMSGMAMHDDGGSGHQHMMMSGALGSYPTGREASGTAWQPDSSQHEGVHIMSGDWTLMLHGTLNFVADHQSSPRGDDKAFVSGHFLGTARRPLGDGTLQFRAALSPDPLMGARGFPLLLQTGETANGRDRLIDRQHPHDVFVELSTAISQNVAPKTSVFLYAALPGEPAFGPPIYLHREAIMDSPEAPISHHWLDSTHASFGVLTAGIVYDRAKLEVSRFNGREPDQHRWNIETGPLDSTSTRLSWNPTHELALQASWADLVDPEQLEPGVNQTRWSASALYAREIAPGWRIAGTLAWGRKSSDGHSDDAYAAEASIKHAEWTVFGRAETVQNRELIQGLDEPSYRVGKVSLGAVRDFRIADHLSLGAGGLFAVNFVPSGLSAAYGSRNPAGAMGFVRLKID